MSQDDTLVEPIAAFIGARLQYPNPQVNGQGNPWVSTILVKQHKSKFGKIRVYCKLAWPALVKEKWEWLKANQQLKETLRSRYFPADVDVSDDEPTAVFYDRCIKKDAMHYREVYMDMVALKPHLRSKICSEADYSELLLGSYDEVVAEIDRQFHENPAWFERYFKLYRCSSLDALKGFMKTIYEPSFKDQLSVSG